MHAAPRGWVVLLEICSGGVSPASSEPLPVFRPNVIFATQFQTWPLKISPFQAKIAKIYLLDRQAKHAQFETKMFKIFNRFQTKTAQKPYLAPSLGECTFFILLENPEVSTDKIFVTTV